MADQKITDLNVCEMDNTTLILHSTCTGGNCESYAADADKLKRFVYGGNDCNVQLGYQSCDGGCGVAIGSGAWSCCCDTVVGYNACAPCGSSVVLGADSCSQSERSVAVGYGAKVLTNSSGGMAIGYQACVSDCQSLAVGYCSYAYKGTAIGYNAFAGLCGSAEGVAVGANACSGAQSIAAGNNANAAHSEYGYQNATAIGHGSLAACSFSTAIGSCSCSPCQCSTTVGYSAAAASLAVGAYANALCNYSTAIGQSTNTYGYTGASVFGYGAFADSDNSLAIGYLAMAGWSGFEGLAIGNSVHACGGIAIGSYSQSGPCGVAFGYNSYAGEDSTAIGTATNSSGGGQAFGYKAFANDASSTSVGYNAQATGGVGVGKDALANSEGVAIGNSSYANTLSSAFGYDSNADSCSVAIGANSNAISKSIVIGNYSSSQINDAVLIGNFIVPPCVANNRVEIASTACGGNFVYNRISGQANCSIQLSLPCCVSFSHPSNGNFGNEDGTLPEYMYTASIHDSGTKLRFFVNFGGTIKYGDVNLTS